MAAADSGCRFLIVFFSISLLPTNESKVSPARKSQTLSNLAATLFQLRNCSAREIGGGCRTEPIEAGYYGGLGQGKLMRGGGSAHAAHQNSNGLSEIANGEVECLPRHYTHFKL